MHYLNEAQLGCFEKLFLAEAPVGRDHPGLATLLDRSWAVCGDDGVASLTRDGVEVARFSIGWRRGDEAADSRAKCP